MSGWRDSDGRTAADRRKVHRAGERARLFADARHRPLTLLKGFAGLVLIGVLVFALIGALR